MSNIKDIPLLDSMIKKFIELNPEGTRAFIMNRKTYNELDYNGLMFYKGYRIYIDFTVEDDRVLMGDIKVL
jgi:hypothetical protein